MKRIRAYGFFLLVLVTAGIVQLHSQGTATRPRRIAVFGSSVAFGTGDEFNKEGYTGLLRAMLTSRGWEVLNQSRGGDTTKTMAPRFAPERAPLPNVRYLLPVNPGYVVIGLSLANEGILEAETKEAKDAVFKQYASGIKGFIDRSRQNNIVPVVGLVYPRMSYTPIEYEYVRRMNLLQNSWDVPTVNFLGAVDDGTGKYARGFDFDDRHPNAAGHHEMVYAFVPTLFDALEKGKPLPAAPSEPAGFARVSGSIAPFTFTTEDPMHSFALAFSVRAESDGTVAAVTGSILDAKTEMKISSRGNSSFESISLTPGPTFNETVRVENGKWIYQPANGAIVRSEIRADSQWHHIVLSHYTARGESLFFIDGKLIGKVAERLQPDRFVLAGPASADNRASPKQADYKDLFLFRSALNADEAAALNEGKLLQASLEVYAPLGDAEFRPGSAVENRAQSMTFFKTGSGNIVHVNNPR
jgi:lysophospholipase L1-like esterase